MSIFDTSNRQANFVAQEDAAYAPKAGFFDGFVNADAPQFWIVGSVVAIFIGWWVVKLILSLTIPPEVSGRAYLKQELKRRGVDVLRIPDRALDEIVQFCLSGARGMAMMSQLSSHGRAEEKNWRANLVRSLQAHAALVQDIMAGGRSSPTDEKIREILVRNGVIRS